LDVVKPDRHATDSKLRKVVRRAETIKRRRFPPPALS
jgi:hypothetical protein